MKIKKTKVKVAAAPLEGGPAIADRFRLDVPAAGASAPVEGTVSRKAAAVAFAFGLVALAVSGVLVFVLYKHWEYLMPA